MENHVTKKDFDDRMIMVDQRFDQIDQRFDKVEQRLGLVEFGLHELGVKFRELSLDVAKKFDYIIHLLDKDANKTGRLDAEVASAHSRIDRVEKHIGIFRKQNAS